jgi:hypothetical protein
LSQAVVRLRGWPVPFIDNHQPLLRHQDWIGQDIGMRDVPHEEAWRFFTSGQFAQLRVISVDMHTGPAVSSEPIDLGPVIETWEILFYLTELVELASRLALSHAGSDQMTIDVRLHGLKDRRLISGTPARMLVGDHRTSAQTITEKRTLQRDFLIAKSRQVAVDISRAMFLRFGFKASQEVLTDYQRELTGGR